MKMQQELFMVICWIEQLWAMYVAENQGSVDKYPAYRNQQHNDLLPPPLCFVNQVMEDVLMNKLHSFFQKYSEQHNHRMVFPN